MRRGRGKVITTREGVILDSTKETLLSIRGDAMLDQVPRLEVFGKDAPEQLAPSEHDLVGRFHATMLASSEVESEDIAASLPIVANGFRNGDRKPC